MKVHICRGKGAVKKRYHTDAECPRINSARTVREVELSLIDTHFSECKECSAEGTDRSEVDFSAYNALKAAADGEGWEP
jgi:hypothetical protein